MIEIIVKWMCVVDQIQQPTPYQHISDTKYALKGHDSEQILGDVKMLEKRHSNSQNRGTSQGLHAHSVV